MRLARRSQETWQELVELVAAWEVYSDSVQLSDYDNVRREAGSYGAEREFYRALVAAGINGPAWPKGLMAGLRQGSREVFAGIASTFRSHPEVVVAIVRAGGQSLRSLLNYPAQVARMIKRGKIRSVDEYYTVRARLDDIEGCDEHRLELQAIYGLLGRYEQRR